jgi:hypothetical protein
MTEAKQHTIKISKILEPFLDEIIEKDITLELELIEKKEENGALVCTLLCTEQTLFLLGLDMGVLLAEVKKFK